MPVDLEKWIDFNVVLDPRVITIVRSALMKEKHRPIPYRPDFQKHARICAHKTCLLCVNPAVADRHGWTCQHHTPMYPQQSAARVALSAKFAPDYDQTVADVVITYDTQKIREGSGVRL